MEKAAPVGNSRQLLNETGITNPTVNKTISDKDETTIYPGD